MKFKSNNMLVLRRILFTALIVVTAVLESSENILPPVKGVNAFVLIPLVVCIALFEKSVPALLFGTFAGVMWDMYSITAEGFFSVVLSAVGFFTAIIILFYMRNNIATAVILSFVWSFLCNTLYWLNFIFFRDYTSPFYIYLRYYLPSVFYTAAFAFVFYFIVKYIFVKTTPERKRINY